MNPNRRIAAVAAALASFATLGSVAVLFQSAGSGPWLPSEKAALVAHCDAQTAAAQRRACVNGAIARQGQVQVAVDATQH
jgi:hypothetical protein